MKNLSYIPTLFAVALLAYGCAGDHYPKDMTRAERKEYYREFNESKTDEEWKRIRDSIDASRSSKIVADGSEKDSASSIPISIKNNSLFSKKLRISDNVLDFGPLATRYVGFRPGTKVYLVKDEDRKDEYIFTITENDKGKSFKISK